MTLKSDTILDIVSHCGKCNKTGVKNIVYKLKNKYIENMVSIKKIGDKYKLSCSYLVLNQMFEYERNFDNRGQVNDEKLNNNISRAKSTVYELALCNPWDHFVTLTLDKNKYDRYNLDKYVKDLSQFIRNQRRKYKTDIKYLLIPEQHKDGAWHIHGFLMGLKSKMLTENAHGYMDWIDYTRKFGYCSIDTIKHKNKAASYITKYISKDFSRGNTKLNAKMYYCSQGLCRAETIKIGLLNGILSNPDYVGEYATIKWFDSLDSALDYVI